ncbi:Uncharacterised protein g10926 [Pycnogonum litorale]
MEKYCKGEEYVNCERYQKKGNVYCVCKGEEVAEKTVGRVCNDDELARCRNTTRCNFSTESAVCKVGPTNEKFNCSCEESYKIFRRYEVNTEF